MFFFKRKSRQTITDFSFLHTDIHSHLIPGIDDGARDMETALELVRGLRALGFKRLITTPHVLPEFYPNTKEIIVEGGQRLQEAVKMAGIEVEIGYAAEYFLDEKFGTLLEKDELLTLPKKHLLVEMSFFAAPPELEEYIFHLKIKGYQPILAHPERYLYLAKIAGKYERLRDMGCLFQLNLLSLIGYYGKPVQSNAELLLKKGWVEFFGTDCHHSQHIRLLESTLAKGRFTLPWPAVRNSALAGS